MTKPNTNLDTSAISPEKEPPNIQPKHDNDGDDDDAPMIEDDLHVDCRVALAAHVQSCTVV